MKTMNTSSYITALAAAIADHAKHGRALDKAREQAELGNVPKRNANGDWEILSSDGKQIYTITADGCSCVAGQNHQLCWHMKSTHIAKAVEAAELVDVAPKAFTAEDIAAMNLDTFMDDYLLCEKVA